MASYFVPIRSWKLPQPDLVMYRSDGSFRHFSFLMSVALLCLAFAFTFFAELAFVYAHFEPRPLAFFYRLSGTFIFLLTWSAYGYFLYKVWVNDGRKELHLEEKRG